MTSRRSEQRNLVYRNLSIAFMCVIFAVPVHALEESVRVFYKPSGEVSILYFTEPRCQRGEEVLLCREEVTNNSDMKGLPYDDVPVSSLPSDSSSRAAWRGEKGLGVWVDTSLVTVGDEFIRLRDALDAERAKSIPDNDRIADLQLALKEIGSMSQGVLTKDQVAYFKKLYTQPNALRELFQSVGAKIGAFIGEATTAIGMIMTLFNSQIGTVDTESP